MEPPPLLIADSKQTSYLSARSFFPVSNEDLSVESGRVVQESAPQTRRLQKMIKLESPPIVNQPSETDNEIQVSVDNSIFMN